MYRYVAAWNENLLHTAFDSGTNVFCIIDHSDSKFQNDFQRSSTSCPSRRNAFNLRVPGRIVLNVWTFMQHEVRLMLSDYCSYG